jgi:hypothetical protein
MTALSQMKDSDLKDMGVPMVSICIVHLCYNVNMVHSDVFIRSMFFSTPALLLLVLMTIRFCN